MQETQKSPLIGRAIFAASAVAAVGAVVYATQFRAAPPAMPARAAALAATAPADSLAEAVRKNPKDAAAWMALGQRQFDAGDVAAAAESYRHATDLAPDNADAWSAFGEAQVSASAHDPMPAGALAAFRKAAAINPRDPRARYFLAVERDLSGDHRGAIDDWLALLKDTPPGAPWEADLKRTIEQVGAINKIDVATRIAAVRPAQPPAALTAGNAIPGPSAEDLHAAAGMAPDQQQAMVEGMVTGLERKLQANPANVDGWVMLMRSRVTMGQPDKAAKALKDAIAANPAAAQRLRAEAQVLGIKGG